MNEGSKRLGGNPLSSLTNEEKGESSKILRDNLISYKARKRCVHLKYSENYEQHQCDSPRSRQRGLLGKDWMDKCRQCHVKILDDKEPESQNRAKPGMITKILSIR
ncbi:MAG: hypothetical protein L6408_06850 [Nanoarchaeota archaeon]|nr:hypothetical protein [Nanoarchaeota archaeon]